MNFGDLRGLIETAPAIELPKLIGELEALKAAAWARLTTPMPSKQDAPELVTPARMAEIVGCPEHWIRSKARGGLLPVVQMGHYVRFEPAAVIDAVRKLRLSAPQSHNGQLRTPKKHVEKRGGRRGVSTECPIPSGAEGARPA